jgi:hypothetical protein
MTAVIKHAKTSDIADVGDPTLVQPSDWNADHVITGLGGAALLDVGTTAGTVCAGNDSRLSDARAPTSHNQTASTITDFSEAVDDRINSLLVAGSNVTLTYDDTANTLTIASSGGGGGSYTVHGQTAGTVTYGDEIGGYDTSGTAERKFLAEEVAALAMPNGGYVSGRTQYFYPWGHAPATTTVSLATNRIYYALAIVGAKTTIATLRFHVTTAVASSTCRVGLYKFAGGSPTSLVVDGGTADTSTTGAKSVVVNTAVEPGVYAIAIVTGATGVIVARSGIAGSQVGYALGDSVGPNTASAPNTSFYEDVGSASLPSTAGTVAVSSANSPSVCFTV